MNEDEFYQGLDVGIDIYMDRALKAEAKVNELEMQLVPLQQQFDDWAEQNREYHATATRRKELLVRAMNALEGWRILLDMPITDIMIDIEKELPDAVGSKS